MENNFLFEIALTLVPGIGNLTAKKLLAYTGSAEAVFKEKKASLLKIPGIGNKLTRELNGMEFFKEAEEELKFIQKYGITPLYYMNKNYPQRLKECEDSPVLLFYKGKNVFNSPKVLSLVGTRNATDRGKANCENLIKELNQNGHNSVIISGLAYGIDICAHKAALKNGLPTVAVLAHGFDRIYPAAHKSIAKEIIETGGLLTEFLSNSKLERQNFVKRNRIIAGISDATIVVESDVKGGSLITAEIAAGYNRDVFAFPGRITDKYATGCNQLIKKHQAALLEGVKDLEYILSWDKKKNKAKQLKIRLFNDLNTLEKQVVDEIEKHEKINIDILCRNIKQSSQIVSVTLLALEFKGLVRSLPGKMYALI